MAATHPHYSRRDEASAFDSKMFYTFNNPTLSQYSLSAGIYTDTNGAINMTAAGGLSSENWQLFFQSGRYFIRNYDYGAKWQLGLTDDSRSVPKLYPRSGSTSQQWTISKVDGGWEMVNGLWGKGTVFALPKDWPIPAMRSETEGSAWNITANPSAAKSKPLTGDSLSDVADIKGLSSTVTASLSTPSASVSSSATASIPAGIVTPLVPSPSSTTSPQGLTGPTGTSPALATGAIVGIVIGVVALLAAIISLLWFFCVKKKRSSSHNNPYEVHGTPIAVEKYAYDGAELASPPAELAVNEKETVKNRVELDSSSATSGENTRRTR